MARRVVLGAVQCNCTSDILSQGKKAAGGLGAYIYMRAALLELDIFCMTFAGDLPLSHTNTMHPAAQRQDHPPPAALALRVQRPQPSCRQQGPQYDCGWQLRVAGHLEAEHSDH